MHYSEYKSANGPPPPQANYVPIRRRDYSDDLSVITYHKPVKGVVRGAPVTDSFRHLVFDRNAPDDYLWTAVPGMGAAARRFRLRD